MAPISTSSLLRSSIRSLHYFANREKAGIDRWSIQKYWQVDLDSVTNHLNRFRAEQAKIIEDSAKPEPTAKDRQVKLAQELKEFFGRFHDITDPSPDGAKGRQAVEKLLTVTDLEQARADQDAVVEMLDHACAQERADLPT